MEKTFILNNNVVLARINDKKRILIVKNGFKSSVENVAFDLKGNKYIVKSDKISNECELYLLDGMYTLPVFLFTKGEKDLEDYSEGKKVTFKQLQIIENSFNKTNSQEQCM